MPLFNRFPYTNFHELNLDWILEQIPILKKYRDETEELHDDTKVLHDDTKVLHDDTKVLHDNVVEQHKEITAEITQGKKDISDLTTKGKTEITELTEESKQDITDLTNSGKSALNSIITTGTNQLDTLIDTGKADIKTLTDSGKSTIETATTTGKAEITNTVTDGKAQIATAKDGALEAIGTAKDSATTTIKNLESSATSAITAKGDLYLHKIEDEGTKQTQAVTDTGTTQINNITQLGDSYKTEMTTLKNEAQTSADNAKASETKAQEYAETAKTLKPMYWGGDLGNLKRTSDVKEDCVNFLNTGYKFRYSNLLILPGATSSPDNTKGWQCKLSIVSSASLDLLAWSEDGEMYVGSLTSPDDDIVWNKTVNLDEIQSKLSEALNTINERVTETNNSLNATNTRVNTLENEKQLYGSLVCQYDGTHTDTPPSNVLIQYTTTAGSPAQITDATFSNFYFKANIYGDPTDTNNPIELVTDLRLNLNDIAIDTNQPVTLSFKIDPYTLTGNEAPNYYMTNLLSRPTFHSLVGMGVTSISSLQRISIDKETGNVFIQILIDLYRKPSIGAHIDASMKLR